MAIGSDIGLAIRKTARALGGVTQPCLLDGHCRNTDHRWMRVGSVDTVAGTDVVRPTPTIRTIGAAVSGSEQNIGARVHEGSDDLIEWMLGIRTVVLRRANRRIISGVEQAPTVVHYQGPRLGAKQFHEIGEGRESVRKK